jgi:hypothetical protein
MIQRPGNAALSIEVVATITVGAGERDGVRVPEMAEGALAASPSAGGIILEARAAGLLVAGTPLAPGRRRLLRPGERAEAGSVAMWPAEQSPPEGTRALAGAILAGAVPAAPSGPHLLVVEGPAAGRRLALRDGSVVGRGREAELHLEDPLASRRHAVFTLRGGRPCLRDLSKNGLAVNGRRAGRRGIPLRPGDTLALGDSLLVYEDGPYGQEPGAAPIAPGLACPTTARHAPEMSARRPGQAHRAAAVLGAVALLGLSILLALAAG